MRVRGVTRFALLLAVLSLLVPLAESSIANAAIMTPCNLSGSFHFEPGGNNPAGMPQWLVILSLRGTCTSAVTRQQADVSFFTVGFSTQVGLCSGAIGLNGLELGGDYRHTRPGQATTQTRVRMRLIIQQTPFPGAWPVKLTIRRESDNAALGAMAMTTRIYSMCPPAGDDNAVAKISFLKEPGDVGFPLPI